MSRQIIRLGLTLKKSIGKHVPLIGTCCEKEKFDNARKESDEAVQLAKYLIMHLDNRHHAVLLAKSAGIPGYINMR